MTASWLFTASTIHTHALSCWYKMLNFTTSQICPWWLHPHGYVLAGTPRLVRLEAWRFHRRATWNKLLSSWVFCSKNFRSQSFGQVLECPARKEHQGCSSVRFSLSQSDTDSQPRIVRSWVDLNWMSCLGRQNRYLFQISTLSQTLETTS